MPSFPPVAVEVVLGAACLLLFGAILHLKQRLTRSEESFREIENLAHVLAENLETGSIVARAFEGVRRLGPVSRFEIYLYDESDRITEIWRTTPQSPDVPMPAEAHPYLGKAVERERVGALTAIESTYSLIARDLEQPSRGRSKFQLPLYSGKTLVGHWILEFSAPPGLEEFERLKGIYRFVTDALYAERNLRLAARDGLSNLYVRRYFDIRLGGEIVRAARYGHPLSVAAFDLDHFKELNDAHGHAAGDEIIRAFAGILRGTLRQQDLSSRRGGEEFAAYFPETTPDAALTVCERIRASLETTPVSFEGKMLRQTVSVGLTGNEPADTPETILSRADDALYRAKNQGRNRVIVIP